MKCKLCDSKDNIERHHTSYNPEETVPLCQSCHRKVHKNPSHKLHPEISFDRAVISVSGDGKITIPKEARYIYGIENGDQLLIKEDDGKLVISDVKIETTKFKSKDGNNENPS